MNDEPAVERRLPGGLRLQAGEGPLLLVMAALVGFLLAGYTIAKVLRDSLFISAYGALSLPFGYVAVVVASVLIVAIEPLVTRSMSRSSAISLSHYVAIACATLAALLYPIGGHWLPAVFYVWAGSQAIMLIPYFWVVALDVWDARRARDVFPLLTAAGLVGGVAGGAFATWGAYRLGTQGLLWTLVATLVVVHVLSLGLDRRIPSRPYASQNEAGKSRLAIVLESRYLRLLGITLTLSVMAGTLIDFQFKFAAQRLFEKSEELTRFLGVFYAGLNGLALVMQIGVAGWMFKRLGLFASSALQPLAVLAFSGAFVAFPRWGVILALRWVQGVLSQTLGKSASEIYFMAMRAPERERVKPGLDTLVERGADGLVGLLLIVALHSFGFDIVAAAAITGTVALAWLVAVVLLRRGYVREFRESLSGPGRPVPLAASIPRDPQSRRALVTALASDDDHQVELALRIARHVKRADVVAAVRAVSLERKSPAVRAAAVDALAMLRVPDPSGTIAALLDGERPDGDGAGANADAADAAADERLRRAAVRHGLALARDPGVFARALLERPDHELRTLVLEELLADGRVTRGARGAIPIAWIDGRLEAGAIEDLIEAALAIALLPGSAGSTRLRPLLEHEDVEVRRAALRAAAARPNQALLAPIMASLGDRALGAEAREAITAFGDAAVPALRRVVREPASGQARFAASQALARLGTGRAANVLLEMARSADPETRYDGLRNLNRIRQRTRAPLVPRSLAHRMFLREIADYRGHLEPVVALESTTEPTARLLRDSYAESADRALERAFRALACTYDPAPFRAIYAHLSESPASKRAAQALEYLAHLLPPKVFRAARGVFEDTAPREDAREDANPAAREASEEEQLRRIIELAWRKGDDWLRACAVAVVRAWPALEIPLEPREDESALVLAELRGGNTSPADPSDREDRPC